jgi:acetyltransferase
VALKLLSERIQHKTDVGGVVLDLDDEPAVRAAFDSIRTGAETVAADAFEGVIVQPMVGDGVDLIVGTVRDPQFGPLVMIGSGGVAVETLGDVRFALAPVGYREATDLLNQTVAGRLLRMTRGRPEGDIEAAVDAIVRVSALAASVDDLSEMDINPLRVFARGKGAVALDVRIRSGDGTD